ncbi:ethanolamine phosphate phosphodiesterase [Entomortierella parvispora]|uniref:Ethanolamine phosphate phosphodiesterase n=1 Tax=Entomortierella parvispora TaxID=205924 RepID=A0A9P3H9V7_9FUNG|nr:ethanolamine phosphate phosphodiesterase [Entomortierella parvispora]
MIIHTLLALLRTLTVIAVLASLLLYNYARISCHWHWRKSESFLRMVVIADPQMEGDAKIARLGKRAVVDLAFNDAYMRHIYSAMTKPSWGHPRDWLESLKEAAVSSQSAQPTHVSILGDLFSSQWIDNTEFETRLRRYMSIFPASVENDHPVLINITGNHDIGYGYDISQERMDRWEGAFGLSNFVQVVKIPGSQQHVHLVALNTMLLDGPSADEKLRGQTWEFLQESAKIKEQYPDDKIVLLTHIPFHKESGICVDPPSIHVHSDNTIVEQTMLTPNSTLWILDHLQPDFVLNGHDHFGCDVIHTPSWNSEQEKYSWTAKRTEGEISLESPVDTTYRKPVREVTQRSMMAEFGGYSGLFEIKSTGPCTGKEPAVNDVEFHYTSCGFVTDIYVWIVIVIDIIVVTCWGIFSFAFAAFSLATSKKKKPTNEKKEKLL